MYEFDIKKLLQVIKSKRTMLIRNGIIGALLAIVVGYSIPKEYSSDVVLAAEVQNESGIGGSAASLASLAGIKLGDGTDAIAPSLYPNVVSSNEFIVDMLYSQVATADGAYKGTYLTYLADMQRSPWWSYPMKWIRMAIGALMGADKAKVGEDTPIDPLRLSVAENGLVEGVRSLVICSVDQEYGTITISAHAQDPLVAKILVDSATVKLQDFITGYRTNKARVDLNYYRGLEKDALDAYRKAQHDFAMFQDSHRNVTLQSFINQRESLENDVQLAFTAYTQMRQQVLMAVAKVQEKTPAFTVIEAASVPATPDAPRKKFILIAFLFVSVIGSLGWIYFKLLFFHKEGANQ